MHVAPQSTPWTDPRFVENQRNFSAAELLRYQGQHIAWSWDGAVILAAADNRHTLDEKLQDAGIDPQQVVYDYVDESNLSYLE